MRDSTAELIKIRAAKAWRPQPGDMIDGVVVKMLRRESEHTPDGVYPVLIIDTKDGAYTAVHAFHSLLLEQLREVKTGPGDEVTIVYQGRVESKNDAVDKDPETGQRRKRSYHSYLLVTNGVDASTEFSWDDATAGKADDEPGF